MPWCISRKLPSCISQCLVVASRSPCMTMISICEISRSPQPLCCILLPCFTLVLHFHALSTSSHTERTHVLPSKSVDRKSIVFLVVGFFVFFSLYLYLSFSLSLSCSLSLGLSLSILYLTYLLLGLSFFRPSQRYFFLCLSH